MISNVTLLNGSKVVELLRDLLERAEKGELLSVVACYETKDQSLGHALATARNASWSALVGELHLAMMTLHVESGRLTTP
jgi:hypothetical protein